MSNLDVVDERSERIQRRFEGPVLAAALLVIPGIAVEEARPGDPWETLAAATNWAIWLLFVAEVVTGLLPGRALTVWGCGRAPDAQRR